MNQHLPIACNLSAFTETEKKRYDDLSKRMKENVLLIEESDAGYKLPLIYNKTTWLETAEWITLEHVCCPFFRFALQLGLQDEMMILHITGPEGAKQILKQEFLEEGCC